MALEYTPGRTNFGLLPEPERNPVSLITSFLVNGTILAVVLYIGATARHVLESHHYEMTELIIPNTPPPPTPKVKMPPLPKLPPPPQPPKLQMEAPKIEMPKPKPEPKPIQMEAKLALPVMKPAAKPAIILAPQPKAALTAAMPAQNAQVKPSTAPVHLGETFGATPNPNATRPATIAAIGNPYGGTCRARPSLRMEWSVPPALATASNQDRTPVRWAGLPRQAYPALPEPPPETTAKWPRQAYPPLSLPLR